MQYLPFDDLILKHKKPQAEIIDIYEQKIVGNIEMLGTLKRIC